MAQFDDYFKNTPKVPKKPLDWNTFWKQQIRELNKVPIDFKKVEKKKTLSFKRSERFTEYEYYSIGKYLLKSRLYLPKTTKKKIPVLVIFPDYSETLEDYEQLTEQGHAVFLLFLRGHDNIYLDDTEEKSKAKNAKSVDDEDPKEEKVTTLGYFAENLLQKKDYYMRQLYLDAYRSIEALRLLSSIDKTNIAILGKGVGGAMALFVQYFMPRAHKIILEEPSFINIQEINYQNPSKFAKEIISYLQKHKADNFSIRKNLLYFDPIYFAMDIKIPISMLIDFELKSNYPKDSFALFHAIKSSKDMHIFTEDASKALIKKHNVITKEMDLIEK